MLSVFCRVSAATAEWRCVRVIYLKVRKKLLLLQAELGLTPLIGDRRDTVQYLLCYKQTNKKIF